MMPHAALPLPLRYRRTDNVAPIPGWHRAATMPSTSSRQTDPIYSYTTVNIPSSSTNMISWRVGLGSSATLSSPEQDSNVRMRDLGHLGRVDIAQLGVQLTLLEHRRPLTPERHVVGILRYAASSSLSEAHLSLSDQSIQLSPNMTILVRPAASLARISISASMPSSRSRVIDHSSHQPRFRRARRRTQ